MAGSRWRTSGRISVIQRVTNLLYSFGFFVYPILKCILFLNIFSSNSNPGVTIRLGLEKYTQPSKHSNILKLIKAGAWKLKNTSRTMLLPIIIRSFFEIKAQLCHFDYRISQKPFTNKCSKVSPINARMKSPPNMRLWLKLNAEK
jgi:hypothetical protein